MYTYFVPTPTTPAEAKEFYRQLAMQHHPDRGGNTATMQAINAEYAALLGEIAHASETKRRDQAHAEGRRTNVDFVDLEAVAEEVRKAIEAALELPEIEVELCGLWVWVTGNTKPVREQLKAARFRWAPKKEAWYFAGIPSMGRGAGSLDDIRSSYGSTKFNRRQPRREDRELEALPA
ncbi:MAG: hypothetical protein ACOYYS_19215 [Chloroflexota bacterium]